MENSEGGLGRNERECLGKMGMGMFRGSGRRGVM